MSIKPSISGPFTPATGFRAFIRSPNWRAILPCPPLSGSYSIAVTAGMAKILLDKYIKHARIGEGTYGKVYKCTMQETGQIFALKKTRSLKPFKEGIPSTTLREIDLLKMLPPHPHVIKLFSVEEGVDKNLKPVLFIVYEYMETDLNKFIRSNLFKNSTSQPMIIKMLMFQLLSGLAYCHSNGVLHRDLKPSNLLLNLSTGLLLKIGDFGLGRGYFDPERRYTLDVVTTWYRAPELLLGDGLYSTPVDMWAVGCIFAEMYRGRSLFRRFHAVEQIHEIFQLLGTPDENVWPGVTQLAYWHEFPEWKPDNLAERVPTMDPQAFDLLTKMLQYNPDNRITAKRAMCHRYFSELHSLYR